MGTQKNHFNETVLLLFACQPQLETVNFEKMSTNDKLIMKNYPACKKLTYDEYQNICFNRLMCIIEIILILHSNIYLDQ